MDSVRMSLLRGICQIPAYVAHEKASTLTTMGRADEAEVELERALAAYREAGNVYGEGGAMGVGVRLAASRQDHELAEARARAALDHARHHDLDRLVCLRLIDRAKALLELKKLVEAHAQLNEALALALDKEDHAAQFFIYHARWRVRLAEGDRERAPLELSAAQYAIRYVDEAGPEAREVRSTMSGIGRSVKGPPTS
jgi:tetratricopeptide (TPR) repeat protein